jgi:hypothetical protein
MFGMSNDNKASVTCEHCRVKVDSSKIIYSYGPEILYHLDGSQYQKPHWFCSERCKDEANK